MAKTGRPPKWGEPVRSSTIRFPESHYALHERMATALGLPFGEYVVRVLAEQRGLELPPVEVPPEQEEFRYTA